MDQLGIHAVMQSDILGVLDQLGDTRCNAESSILGILDHLGIHAVMQSDILGVLDQLGIHTVCNAAGHFWCFGSIGDTRCNAESDIL